MAIDKQLFATRLLASRLTRKLTQEALGKKAGVDAYKISLYERNKRFPLPMTLASLACALDVTVPWLLGQDGDKPNMEKLGSGLFIVRTQAGFRRALKNHAGSDWHHNHDPIAYPEAYPALIWITRRYNGGTYPLTIVDFTTTMPALAPHLQELMGPRREAPAPKPPRSRKTTK